MHEHIKLFFPPLYLVNVPLAGSLLCFIYDSVNTTTGLHYTDVEGNLAGAGVRRVRLLHTSYHTIQHTTYVTPTDLELEVFVSDNSISSLLRLIMDQILQFVEPMRQFSKDSVRLVKRCTKPDRKGTEIRSNTEIPSIDMPELRIKCSFIRTTMTNIYDRIY